MPLHIVHSGRCVFACQISEVFLTTYKFVESSSSIFKGLYQHAINALFFRSDFLTSQASNIVDCIMFFRHEVSHGRTDSLRTLPKRHKRSNRCTHVLHIFGVRPLDRPVMTGGEMLVRTLPGAIEANCTRRHLYHPHMFAHSFPN
jgi:hypothetical protein